MLLCLRDFGFTLRRRYDKLTPVLSSDRLHARLSQSQQTVPSAVRGYGCWPVSAVSLSPQLFLQLLSLGNVRHDLPVLSG